MNNYEMDVLRTRLEDTERQAQRNAQIALLLQHQLDRLEVAAKRVNNAHLHTDYPAAMLGEPIFHALDFLEQTLRTKT